MEFSRCARTGVREKIRPEDGLSKLNSARYRGHGDRINSVPVNLE
jgi:hypothetical protein